MIYPLSLEKALVFTGLWLVLIHAIALFKGPSVREWLKSIPRSKPLGTLLLVIATVWSFWLISTIDLGEFSNWRDRLKVIIPVAAALTYLYADEFLTARGLGMIVLLGAEPLLESAFLRPEITRLFLVTLVYIWIVFALFWIGSPYTLRDQINWIIGSEKRWKLAAFAGLAYGALLLLLPATY
jgi:multisubunit Na+/H+ antiporter MnhG subunit